MMAACVLRCQLQVCVSASRGCIGRPNKAVHNSCSNAWLQLISASPRGPALLLHGWHQLAKCTAPDVHCQVRSCPHTDAGSACHTCSASSGAACGHPLLHMHAQMPGDRCCPAVILMRLTGAESRLHCCCMELVRSQLTSVDHTGLNHWGQASMIFQMSTTVCTTTSAGGAACCWQQHMCSGT
jgi:hypothetical protein